MAETVNVEAPLDQEGTKAVVRAWLKQVGEAVMEGDPLVELETDKVTQEVPSPCHGVLSEILMQSGEDASPGSILGRITASGAGIAAPDQRLGHQASEPPDAAAGDVHYSPAVRRAAAEYGIDPATVAGTGKGGRVTRADMDQAALSRRDQVDLVKTAQTQPPEAAKLPAAGSTPRHPVPSTGLSASRTIPHSAMRLTIAKHMSESLATAPQVTAVFEADFTAITRHRDSNKASMKAEGINLSYTAYIVAACVAAMKAVPEVNSRWHDDCLKIFDDINIGVGTALGDKGLIVPVIAQAQHLSLQGIAARLQELTARARAGTLKGEDLKGGTFTISNHGVSGSLFAAPIIINQPQSAILGVGKLEKRVVVREVDGIDALQIRPMAYVSLTIDHRSLDGHQTNTWLTRFVEALEHWPA